MVDVEALKTQFLDHEFDTREFTLSAEKMATVARVTGEIRPEYLDPSRDDFQATPAFIGGLSASRHLPIDFPNLGGIPMDGGKAVTCLAPVKAGVPLTGRTHLHDIYAKSGRSGRMVFVVSRMEIYDPEGVHVASSDARMVIRERPDA